jgi:hypothetical protein
VSFATIILCVASQRVVVVVVVVYFIIDSDWKLVITPLYAMRSCEKRDFVMYPSTYTQKNDVALLVEQLLY